MARKMARSTGLAHSVLICGKGNLFACLAATINITDQMQEAFCEVPVFGTRNCQTPPLKFPQNFPNRIIVRTLRILKTISPPLNSAHADVHIVSNDAAKMQGVREYTYSPERAVASTSGNFLSVSFTYHSLRNVWKNHLMQARDLSSYGRKIGRVFR